MHGGSGSRRKKRKPKITTKQKRDPTEEALLYRLPFFSFPLQNIYESSQCPYGKLSINSFCFNYLNFIRMSIETSPNTTACTNRCVIILVVLARFTYCWYDPYAYIWLLPNFYIEIQFIITKGQHVVIYIQHKPLTHIHIRPPCTRLKHKSCDRAFTKTWFT